MASECMPFSVEYVSQALMQCAEMVHLVKPLNGNVAHVITTSPHIGLGRQFYLKSNAINYTLSIDFDYCQATLLIKTK